MDFRYALNDRPRWSHLLLYGVQWLLISIPVVLTSTFIAPAGETIAYTQKLFGVMGAMMVIQALCGHRLPLVAGPAAALLMGVISAMAQGYSQSAIYTSIMVGGAFIALIALSGVMSRLQRLFTPRIVISILLLISFTITKPIIGLVFSNPAHQQLAFWFCIIGTTLMAVANNLLRGVWKSTVVMWAMLIGSLIYYAFIGFPSSIATDTQRASLFMEKFDLDWGVVLSFLFCYVALLINQVGSVQSLGGMVGADSMESRNKRGMILVGLGNILSGAVGIIGPVDYSLSPGIVASTRCASRYTVIPAGLAMIAIAFSPTIVGFLMSIPSPVMGTVLLFLMGTQLAAGFEMVRSTGSVSEFRHGMIIALPLLFNVIMTFAPADAISAIPAIVRPIVGNGFVMGVVIILLLEHIFLRDKKSPKA